jgi:periplasmic protein CpxP/Spy
MKLTRLTAFTVLGFALGAGVALSIPHLINITLPVSAQSASSLNPSEETATPQPEPRNQANNGRGNAMGQLFQSLNLTPEQMQKLKSVQKENKDQIREQQRSLRAIRLEMQQMLGNNTPSATVLSKFQDVQQKQQSLNQLRFKSLLAMREVLTPTQRQQLSQQMMKRQGKSQRKGLLNRPEQ